MGNMVGNQITNQFQRVEEAESDKPNTWDFETADRLVEAMQKALLGSDANNAATMLQITTVY